MYRKRYINGKNQKQAKILLFYFVKYRTFIYQTKFLLKYNIDI